MASRVLVTIRLMESSSAPEEFEVTIEKAIAAPEAFGASFRGGLVERDTRARGCGAAGRNPWDVRGFRLMEG